jgi:hypothetical protein
MSATSTTALAVATNPITAGLPDVLTATVTPTGGTAVTTLALLHFDGPNGATSTTDVVGNTVTFTGSGVVISTAQSEFGGSSLFCNDTGAGVGTASSCNIAYGSQFDFGSRDFTLECFVNPSVLTALSNGIFAKRAGPSDYGPFIFVANSTGALQFQASFAGTAWNVSLTTSAGAISVGVWTHVAVVRHGSVWTVYVNGVASATQTIAGSLFVEAQPIAIGSDYSGGNLPFSGYIDEFRASNAAMYTANFTPPAAPFTILGQPSGNVQFFDGVTSLGSSTLSSNVATLTRSFSTGGTHALSAAYAGDTNYSGSTSPTVNLTVIPPNPTTTSLTVALNPVNTGVSDTLTAVLTQNVLSAPVFALLHCDGVAGASVFPDLGAGANTWTSYPSSNVQTLTTHVKFGPTSMAFNAASELVGTVPLPTNAAFTIEMFVYPNTLAYALFQQWNTAPVLGGISLGWYGGQFGVFQVTSGAPAPVAVVASASGPAISTWTHVAVNYDGTTLTVYVNGASVASAAVAPGFFTHVGTVPIFGNQVYYSYYGGYIDEIRLSTIAQYSGSFTPPTQMFNAYPTGSMNFYDGATLLGSAALTGTYSQSASLTTSFSTIGSHSITAAYPGDLSNANSVSATTLVTVTNPAIDTSTTLLTLSANPIVQGLTEVLTATVSSGSTLSGAVQFFDGSTLLGTATLTAGVATLSNTFNVTGLHNLQAVYLGDGTHLSSSSNTILSVVTPNPAVRGDVTPYLKLITSEYQNVN